MDSLAIVANPHAGGKKRLRLDGRPLNMDRKLRSLLLPGDELTWTNNAEELQSTLERIKNNGFSTIGILGGDGSISMTLRYVRQIFEEPLPKILLLRGGTMNVIATGMNQKGSPPARLTVYSQMRTIGVQTKTHRLAPMLIGEKSGFIFGIGPFVKLVENYYATGKPSPLTAAKLILRAGCSAIFSTAYAKSLFLPMDVELLIDGKTVGDQFSLVAAATSPYAGLGFWPFFHSNGQQLHAIHTQCGPKKFLRALPAFFQGKKPPTSTEVFNLEANAMTLKSRKPHPVFIDGDIHDIPWPVTITLGKPFMILEVFN